MSEQQLQQFTGYFNIALVAIFIFILVGVAIAALRGLRRGVWKSTHNMIFMFSLVLIGLITLDPLCKFIENFNIGKYFPGTFTLSQVKDGVEKVYYVPVTSVKETFAEAIKGIYLMFNISSSSASATNFAFAIAESLIKILLFILDMLLIVTVGNLLSFITWYLISRHFVPRIARRTVKIRWLGAIETAVTYLVLTVLFFTPFTSIVNSINQSYQRNKDDNQQNAVMKNIGNFVDAYNDSLFAKILFNWTVDKDGVTIDTKLFKTFTTGISEDVVVNIVDELGGVLNLAMIASNGFVSDADGNMGYDATRLLYKDVVDSAFYVLGKSNLLTNVLPVAAELALNSGALDKYIPADLLDVSDVEWKSEISYVQEMVDALFDSGVIDALMSTDETGKRTFRSFEGNGLYEFLDEVLYSEQFPEILNIFKALDDSKLFSKVVPALVYMLENSENGAEMKQYLPFSWEELNEFSWGYELYVLFDFLHQTITIDRDFLKAFLIQTGSYKPGEQEVYTSLPTVISRNISKFNALIVGELDSQGKPKNADKFGRTIVFDKGKRIEGRNYCLFDMKIFEKALPTVIKTLYDLDFMKQYKGDMSEADSLSFTSAVDKLNSGVVLANFKNEFNSILNILGTLGQDEGLVRVLFGEGLTAIMDDPNNFFSIKNETIQTFKQAIMQIEESKLLYAGSMPIIKHLLSESTITDAFNDVGMKSSILVSAVNHDAKKENHTFFSDFASIFDHWPELSRLFSAISGTDDIMGALKDSTLVDDLTSVLKAVINNPIINPTPDADDNYEKNENLYGLLEYVFSMTASTGFTISRETLRAVESPGHTWGDEIDALGEIIKYVSSHDVLKAADLFNDGLTRGAISDLKDEGEGKVGLPKLFELVDDSYIFRSSLGPFLDQMFADSLAGFLVDSSNNVSFSNVANWATEGEHITNLLNSLYNLIPENDAEAKNFLTDFDMSKLHDVVELNDMLHQISNSGIFTYIDENNVKHYQFGAWFYQKVNDAMDKFTVNSNNYDLLADPKPSEDSSWSWNDNWGVRPGESVTNADPYFVEYQNKYNADGTATDTHMIAYRDFVYFEGLANTDDTLPAKWCDYEQFTIKQAAFLAAHKADLTSETGRYIGEENNYWGAYYASDKFIEDYTDVFECDEISKVCRFLCYSMRVLEKTVKGPYVDGSGNHVQVPFDNLPIPVIEGLLNSINETSSLRICVYSFFRIAAENLLNGYSAFTLSTAYNIYLIDAGYQIDDYAEARIARKAELDRLVDFYKVINKAKEKHIIDSGNNFDYSKLNQDGFLTDMNHAIRDLSDSYVFHRLGSAKVNSLTTFQGMFNSMLSQSSIKDIIYLNESPKDANATHYTTKESKVDYLVKSTFLTDQEITDASLDMETEKNKQHTEIDNLLNTVDAFYSLKDKDGNTVTGINNVDMNKSENIATIESLFTNLNNSNVLKDCLPNSIYKIFNANDQFAIESGGQKVDFKRVDPFYHYYYNDTVARSQADYEARYLASDISDITALLEDYQEFNTQLDGKEMSNPVALKAITGEGGALSSILNDLHNSNLFHTPARKGDYPGLAYYTNKFDNGYTLFEEMIAKICSFVKLDDFAYDAAYDTAYADSAAKLYARIKEVTQADDTGLSSNVYHTGEGTAWSQEIASIIDVAHTAANLGNGTSLDVSSFELETLDPIDIKNMLKAINSSDIICDAIPKFVKQGFENINLGTLTTYNSVNYAQYRLGQVAYGGLDASAPEGSEIDNIYQVMLSLHKEGTPKYYTNMSNLSEFTQGADGEVRLTGLLRYVYKSHILNTSLDGSYDEYNTLASGQKITAQGVMLVNSLGNDLSSYVARDANATTIKGEADRIATLSKIVHMQNYFEDGNDVTYQVEAKGLKRLLDLTTDQITATTFSDNNVETIKSKKNLIIGIVESAYNATNEANESDYKRSAIASEFVSGLFNYILENQYTKLNSKAGYTYILFSFGNDDAETLVLSDYDELGIIERNGLEGVLDSLDYISASSTPNSMKANSAAIKACFAKMGETDGNNSHIAQALYLTEAHQYLKVLRNPLILNSGEMFVPVDETTNDPMVANNVYSNTFSFKGYGEYIDSFLSGATISI